jgi:NtrC-family two-component system sensor histidine kinase KinB
MKIPFFRSLRFKVGVGYVFLVVINILLTGWAIYNFTGLTQSTSILLTEYFPKMISLENMARSIERHESALSMVLNQDPAGGKVRFDEAKNEFYRNFQVAEKDSTNPDLALILSDITATYAGYLLVTDSLFQQAGEGGYAEAKTFYYDRITPFSKRLIDNCFWLLEENQKMLQVVARETRNTSDEASIAVLVASLVAVALSVVTMLQFTKRIIEPAERLTETVHQIGRGRLDLKLDIVTNDEVGELSREFNKMTERLRRYEEMNIQQIITEKNKSETIVESIADAIIVCDSGCRIQLLNQSAVDLLGVREADAVGRPAAEIIGDERLRSFLTSGSGHLPRNEPYLSYRYRNKTIYLRPRVTVIPSRDPAERGGTVLVLQDVTMYKEIDKMKSDFMAAVSHEFRTPLTSINMSVDILRQKLLGPLNAEQEELLAGSRQDCERLTKLVRELLQLSRLEAGKMEFRTEPFDVGLAIDSTLQPLKLPFHEKGVDLSVVCANDLPRLVGDEQQFSWVVSNLVSNALRHTDPGGTVEIRASAENGSVLVQVSDSGKGIPEDQLKNIFDKFVQVKAQQVATPGSVGLGLAIAKEIVELHGGRIWAESRVDEGSRFSFLLPITAGEGA